MTTKLKENEQAVGLVAQVEVVRLSEAAAGLRSEEESLYTRQRWTQTWHALFNWLVAETGSVEDLVTHSDKELVEVIPGFGERSIDRLNRMLLVAMVLEEMAVQTE